MNQPPNQPNALGSLFRELVTQGIRSIVDDIKATTADNPNGMDGATQVRAEPTIPVPPPVPSDLISADAKIAIESVSAARKVAQALPTEFSLGQAKFQGADVHRVAAYTADAINQATPTLHEAMFAFGLIVGESAVRLSQRDGQADIRAAGQHVPSLQYWLEKGIEHYFQQAAGLAVKPPPVPLG